MITGRYRCLNYEKWQNNGNYCSFVGFLSGGGADIIIVIRYLVTKS
ncbi:hypothetical protein CLOSTASPAR_02619 [[Clostridium] asparagiforme DSM 15981]|uniref:Uncharacterized protein n=1 Tax=[Clostridium] asparagiforme DSM 15981 TaxID=518636 RepID=C0D038_9FIRM|nr:hypothetical protein CLOSTASPAR_02619 [[Clostridium] asparagiforme DSM 15981]